MYGLYIFFDESSKDFWDQVEARMKKDNSDGLCVECVCMNPESIEPKEGYSVTQTDIPCTVIIKKNA